MPDREKAFDAFRNCITEPKCKDCLWKQCEQFNQKKVSIPITLALDVLNLLKEQEGYVSVPFSWLVKFCTHIDFVEPLTNAEREVAWRKKLWRQFGINASKKAVK